MRKKFTVFILAAITVVIAGAMLAGCAPQVKIDAVYKHYLYNGFESKFVTTDSSLTFYDDLTFQETYPRFSSDIKSPYVLDGTYNWDKDTDTIYGYLTAASFSSFLKNYKAELKKESGLSQTVIDLLIQSLSDKPTYYLYRDYIFKLDALQAARMGTADENLNSFEGIYNMKGFTSSGTASVKLERGKIFYQESSDPESEYNKLGATYTVRGDFLEVVPNPEDKNDNMPVSQKFLIATLTLPDLTAGDVNNSIIDYGDPEDPGIAEIKKKMSFKKIKVLLLDFYSYKKF